MIIRIGLLTLLLFLIAEGVHAQISAVDTTTTIL